MVKINIDTKIITHTLYNVFNKRDYIVEALYGGSSIRVMSKDTDDEFDIYLRIHKDSNSKLVINISNIIFPMEMRRKGILTKLMDKLLMLSDVGALVFGGVCTEEMHKFCIKNNFLEYSEYCGYIKYNN